MAITINFPVLEWDDQSEWGLLVEDEPKIEFKKLSEDGSGVVLQLRCASDSAFRTGATRRLLDAHQHLFGVTRGGVETIGGPQPAYLRSDEQRTKPVGWVQEFKIRRGLM